MIIKYDNLTEEEFLIKFFSITNALSSPSSRVTDSEIAMLVEFILLPEEKFRYQRFSTLAKSKVMTAANSKGWNLSKVNINNKIYNLIDKGYLKRDEDGVVYVSKSVLSAIASFKVKDSFEIKLQFNAVPKHIEIAGADSSEAELPPSDS